MCKKINHPGIYIDKLLNSMGMSQHDLAVRTGVTDKHISTVINGTKGISASFAKKLSYVFGEKYDYNFWIEKQSEYDKYQIDLAEENNIKSDEYKIFDEIKDVYDFYISKNPEKSLQDKGKVENIINARKFMQVSDLTAISKISYNAAYRAQVKKNIKVNLNVVSAWQRLCETLSEQIPVNNQLNIDLLKSKIEFIKNEMFGNISNGISDLQKTFAECGIVFNVVKHFRGAPVQGFIKQINNDKLLLCLTIRGGFADRFWFTLFHEIGHIVNGDYDKRFVDFDSIDNKIEAAADEFAENTLIDKSKYEDFIQNHNYESEEEIRKFAKDINVQPFIVLGRLQNDNLLEWNQFTNLKPIYKWI